MRLLRLLGCLVLTLCATLSSAQQRARPEHSPAPGSQLPLTLAPEPRLVIYPDTIDFGRVRIGRHRDSVFTIENKGTAPDRLVGAQSAAAQKVEIHEMKMDGNVMRMRELEKGLEIPAGGSVTLAPGGYHLMLQQLKAPLVKDSQVPVTLVFKDAKGALSRLSLQLPVRATAPAAAGAGNQHMGHGGHQH